jgi:hypothetical protein
MPCNISLGYNEPCKDSIAGLTAVYFMNYNTGSFTLNATDVVTAFPTGSTVYKYELKVQKDNLKKLINCITSICNIYMVKHLIIFA